jgi:ubiquinone/menaquinone biosynthesis C-methylase UbiE
METKYPWFDQYIFYVKNKEIQERIHRKLYKIPLEKIRQLGKKILEVGAGPGLETLILQHDGFESIASDIDARIPSQVHVPMGINNTLRADTQELPFHNQVFDVVYSSGLIEHFSDEDIIKMLKEQLRVAKYCYFEVPLLELKIITPHLLDQGERWFTAEEWLEKMSQMGFKVKETTMREWKTMLGIVLCSQ